MVKKNSRKMGRPATGKGLGVLVRFPDKELAALDKWVARDGGLLSRPQAIRRLILLGLEKSEDRASGSAEVQKASQLADRAAENLVDKSMPPEEQQRRKRALIKGPKEFRDIREDQPKPKS
jgi:hypothetical protein